MATTPNLNLELIQDDSLDWGQSYRDALTSIDSAAAEHNLDGTHKTINTPNVVTPKITFPDGTLSSSKLVGGTAQTLAQATALGKEADLGGVDFALTDAGRDLLRVDAKRGLAGMLGNIADPLVCMPMRRANDATRLSGVETFTRAGTGTYIDPTDGLLKTAAIDEPRYERMADGGVGILLEGTSTNRLLNSESDASSTYTNAATGALGLTDPSNGTSAYEITFSTTTGREEKLVQFPVVGEAGTVSRWIRCPTGNKNFKLSVLDGAVGVYSSSILVATTEWQRFEFYSSTPTGSISQCFINSLDDLQSIEVLGSQYEALPFASSYIPTTGTALSRAADRLTIALSGNQPSVTARSMVLDFDLVGLVSYDYIVSTGVATDINGRWVAQATPTGAINNYDGVALITAAGLVAPNAVHRLAITNAKRTYLDGRLVASGNPNANAVLGTGTSIKIGTNENGVAPMYGRLRNFRIYDRELTDQEIGAA